jgi:hypothetical protein
MNSTTQVLKIGRQIARRPPANLDERDDDLFRDAYRYSTFDAKLSQFENASVSADSVIYTRFVLRPESLYRQGDAGYYRFRYLTKKLLKARKVRLGGDRTHLLATDQESIGHFHWLTEVLPRLWLVKDRANDLVLMLPDSSYVRKFGLATIEILGLSFKDIVWMDGGTLYRVPKLVHVSKVCQTGQMDDEIMQELNRIFVRGKSRGNRKLYVSRAKAGFRKIVNEAELEERLKAYGYEVIQPDDWSLERHIAVFSECDTLLSIHGAGLTNCLFMPPGGKVVELRKREPNYGYWHLAESIGHEYFYYHGIPDSDLSLIGRGCNLTIPLEDFEERILKVI